MDSTQIASHDQLEPLSVLSDRKGVQAGEASDESKHLVAGTRKAGIITQLFPALFGVAATIFFRNYIASAFHSGQFLHTLFLPEGEVFEQIVPIAIVFLFFWTMGDLAIKLVIVRRQYRSLAHPAIQGSLNWVGASEVDTAIEGLRVASKRETDGYVFPAVFTLLEHLKATNDSQKSHEYFRHQTDLDSDAILSSYTTARVFIWAMPILGFIGTVMGISFAVGDFSGFLSGDIDDIDLVKQELSNVSTGLSFAFNTTLLGLVASLVAMLLTTYVQTRNEGLIKGVEELCLRIIGRLPHSQSQGEAHLDSNMLLKSMHTFTEIFNKESEQLRNGFEGFNTGFIDVGKRIVEAYSGLGESLNRQTDSFGGKMDELSLQLTSALSDASNTFSNTSAAISKDLECLSPDLENIRKVIAEGLERVNRSSENFENMLQANTQQFIASQDTLANKVDGISPTHELIVKVTQSLERCNDTLLQVQEAHMTLVPLLQKLQGPMEFKMIPSSRENTEGAQ